MRGLAFIFIGTLVLAMNANALPPVVDMNQEETPMVEQVTPGYDASELPPPKESFLSRFKKGNKAPAQTHASNDAQSIEWLNQLEQLRDQVHNLQGQLEQQAHTIEQLQNQQKTFYADLDRRLVTLEPGTKTITSATSTVIEQTKPTETSTKTVHSKKEKTRHSSSHVSSASSGDRKHSKLAKK